MHVLDKLIIIFTATIIIFTIILIKLIISIYVNGYVAFY